MPRNGSREENEVFISSKYRYSGNYINSFEEKVCRRASQGTILGLMILFFILGIVSLFFAVLFDKTGLCLFICLVVMFVVLPPITILLQTKLPKNSLILDIYDNIIVLCERKDPLVEIPENIIYNKTYIEEFLWNDIKALEYTIKEKNSGSDVVIITKFKEIKLHFGSDIESLVSCFSEKRVDVRERVNLL